MPNAAVVQHLQDIANLKGLAGDNPFSVRAYQRAIQALQAMPVVDAQTIQGVEGIGDRILSVVEQYLEMGTTDVYKVLAERNPVECLTMMVVQGIGPKTALKLHGQGIKNWDQLLEAAESGKLLNSKGKTDTKLIKAVLFAKETKAGRVPYDSAKILGDAVLRVVDKIQGVERAELVGSLRRKKATIKDLDIVASVRFKAEYTRVFNQLAAALAQEMDSFEEVARGEVKASLRLKKYAVQMACDVWLVHPASWGAALCYATGSKEHNVRLRALAKERGWLVNEKGIWQGDTFLGGTCETDLYELLGIPYVEPPDRVS